MRKKENKMYSIIQKVKYLVFCYYKGHRFGVTKYMSDAELQVCARCGYRKKKKYHRGSHDDFYIY